MNPTAQTLNLYAGHEDYSVAPGIGPVINYHGAAVDLRKVSKLKADQLANDKAAKYVQYTAAALEKQAKAAIKTAGK